MTNERCFWLVIGNPPVNGMGEFVECFVPDSGWYPITISVKDTPNYKQDKEVIPGVSGRLFEREQARKWGVDSPRYMANVLGEIPFVTEGTVFGTLLGEAMRSGRIRDFDVDKLRPVYTFRDLGPMHNAVIYAQFHDNKIYIVDYYEDHIGSGIEHQVDSQREKPYLYAEHFTGWDVAREGGSNAKDMRGKFILDIFEELGVSLQPIPKYPLMDGVHAVRSMFPRFIINKTRCKALIEAMRQYKIHKVERASVEGKPVYTTEEEKSPATHGCAALRCLALVDQYHRGDLARLPEYIGSEPTVTFHDNSICIPGAIDDFSDMYEEETIGTYMR